MERFVYQQGLSSFMVPGKQHPMTAMFAARYVNKPKAEKKSHSEAESRRRKRINDRLTTLRSILPSKVKTDKATLLMETVQHVKELQRKYAEVAAEVGARMKTQLPTETDSVSVSQCEKVDDENNVTVKASICCEDRPELNRDLVQLIRAIRGKMNRIELATVGGRTKLVMTLKLGMNGCKEAEIGKLRRGLLAVAENRVASHLVRTGSDKRARCVVSNRNNGGVTVGGFLSFNKNIFK